MNKTIILKGQKQFDHLREIIKLIPLDPVHEVVIQPHKQGRSLDQNALYWKWITIMAVDLGNTKDELHELLKAKFLIPILTRDDADYAEIMQRIRHLSDCGMIDTAIKFRATVTRLTSTARLTVPQFKEYLDEIEGEAGRLGIRLPAREE